MYKIIISYSENYDAICECWYNGVPIKSFIVTKTLEKQNINGCKCLNYNTLYKILKLIHNRENFKQLFTTGLQIKMEDLPRELRTKKTSEKVIVKFRKFSKSEKDKLLKVTNIQRNNIPIGISITSLLLIATMALSCIGNKKEENIPYIPDSSISTSDVILSNSDQNTFTDETNESTASIDLSYLLDRETNNYPEYIKSVLAQTDKNGVTCEQIIHKYCDKFGLDPRIIIAIACQESRNGHNPNETSSAIGQMQIERAVWVDEDLEVTDANGNKVKIHIKLENLKDLDSNIMIGCMILKHYLEITDYNLPLALACYNMGPGTMREITGEKNLKNVNQTKISWIEAMKEANSGDPEYIKHIMEWLEHLGLDEPYMLITKKGETILVEFCLERKKIPTIG